jgi:hypothetical protein
LTRQPIPSVTARLYTNRNHPDFKNASQVVLPDQVSTLCLPAKKYLQLMLAQQQIEKISVVAAEQVKILSA